MRIVVIVLVIWTAISVVAALALGAMIRVGRRIPRANAERARAEADVAEPPPVARRRHATIGQRSVAAGRHRRDARGRGAPGRVRT